MIIERTKVLEVIHFYHPFSDTTESWSVVIDDCDFLDGRKSDIHEGRKEIVLKSRLTKKQRESEIAELVEMITGVVSSTDELADDLREAAANEEVVQ